MKLSILPSPNSVRDHPNNGIHRVVLAFERALASEHTILDDPSGGCDLIISNAGAVADPYRESAPLLAVCHGLYPTSHPAYATETAYFLANKRVIADLAIAKEIIVPSQWVADIIRRDMLIEPTVMQWGVDLDQWQPNTEQHGNYVLWNKNRQDPVCNPVHMQKVAELLPAVRFKSTYGNMAANVEILGSQPHERMMRLVKRAAVYLATTKETGDIGSREALAAGVPVVGFKHGAVLDIVQDGVNGVLVPVGDYAALADAIRYCLTHRDTLSYNARTLAKAYDWAYVYPQIKSLAESIVQTPEPRVKVSVVIPCYNYAQYLAAAVNSVLEQQTSFDFEVIIVNDGSTDASEAVALSLVNGRVTYISQHNQGVAQARNAGIRKANGKYVACLDADDRLDAGWLQACYEALEASPLHGIAYTRLRLATGGLTDWLSLPFDFEKQLAGQNQIPTACMYRRADALRVGGYRTDMQPSEDADLFTRLLTFTGKRAVKASEEPLFIYNLHTGSLSEPYRISGRLDPYRERGLPTWGEKRPFIAPAKPPFISNPVFAYDEPLIKVEGALTQGQRDDLQAQTMWKWTLKHDTAPLRFRFAPDQRIPTDFFALALAQERYENDKGQIGKVVYMCCGKIIKKGSANVSNSDFVLCQHKTGMGGKISRKSPTGVIDPTTGRIIDYRPRDGQVSLVHKNDVQARPDWFTPVPSPSGSPDNLAQYSVQAQAPALPPTPFRLPEDVLFPPSPPIPTAPPAPHQLTDFEKQAQAQQAILQAKQRALASLPPITPRIQKLQSLEELAPVLGISARVLSKMVKEKGIKPHDMHGKLRQWDIERLKQELDIA